LSADADSDMEQCAGCLGDEPGQPVLRALGRVLGDLANLRYDACWCLAAASDIGACHRRERVFVLGWDADAEDDGLAYGDPGFVGDGAGGGFRAGRSGEPADGDQVGRPVGGPRVGDLLPMPLAVEAAGTPPDYITLTGLIDRGELFPTPQAHDAKRGKTPAQVAAARARTQAGFSNLNELVETEAARFDDGGWGRFGAAISRHQRMMGRPPPHPVEMGPTGRPRLAARFAEWMMGLSDGWVTAPEICLSRSGAVRALGNGVVPQQAAYAVGGLLRMRERAVRA
jgi:DNA (cytosine-5)-methyltransferase 1